MDRHKIATILHNVSIMMYQQAVRVCDADRAGAMLGNDGNVTCFGKRSQATLMTRAPADVACNRSRVCFDCRSLVSIR